MPVAFQRYRRRTRRVLSRPICVCVCVLDARHGVFPINQLCGRLPDRGGGGARTCEINICCAGTSHDRTGRKKRTRTNTWTICYNRRGRRSELIKRVHAHTNTRTGLLPSGMARNNYLGSGVRPGMGWCACWALPWWCVWSWAASGCLMIWAEYSKSRSVWISVWGCECCHDDLDTMIVCVLGVRKLEHTPTQRTWPNWTGYRGCASWFGWRGERCVWFGWRHCTDFGWATGSGWSTRSTGSGDTDHSPAVCVFEWACISERVCAYAFLSGAHSMWDVWVCVCVLVCCLTDLALSAVSFGAAARVFSFSFWCTPGWNTWSWPPNTIFELYASMRAWARACECECVCVRLKVG